MCIYYTYDICVYIYSGMYILYTLHLTSRGMQQAIALRALRNSQSAQALAAAGANPS
jgi:hypothetical protein